MDTLISKLHNSEELQKDLKTLCLALTTTALLILGLQDKALADFVFINARNSTQSTHGTGFSGEMFRNTDGSYFVVSILHGADAYLDILRSKGAQIQIYEHPSDNADTQDPIIAIRIPNDQVLQSLKDYFSFTLYPNTGPENGLEFMNPLPNTFIVNNLWLRQPNGTIQNGSDIFNPQGGRSGGLLYYNDSVTGENRVLGVWNGTGKQQNPNANPIQSIFFTTIARSNAGQYSITNQIVLDNHTGMGSLIRNVRFP